MMIIPVRTLLLLLLLLLGLLPVVLSEANVITFSKTLFIPGQYFSLMNYTYDLSHLENYFNVELNFELSQVELN